ncbi:hypothetical protein AB0I91_38895 [Actinosynnema sp. NPDC049800]
MRLIVSFRLLRLRRVDDVVPLGGGSTDRGGGRNQRWQLKPAESSRRALRNLVRQATKFTIMNRRTRRAHAGTTRLPGERPADSRI